MISAWSFFSKYSCKFFFGLYWPKIILRKGVAEEKSYNENIFYNQTNLNAAIKNKFE
jgi:hypothetical protein